MGLFRRRNETLNEQLLREAGLDSSQALDDSPPSLEPESSGAAPFPVGDVNLGHRTDRRSRTAPVGHVVTVKAETLAGDRIEFTTLPNGDILIDEEKVVNTTLRFPDEFARHKILDILGDFYLLGRPMRGAVSAVMTGHSDNIALLRQIREGMNL